MIVKKGLVILLILIALLPVLSAQQRFPKPDFDSGYVYPEIIAPSPGSPVWEYIDVGVLVVVLIITTLLTLKVRSRKFILMISLFSMLYFGFFRLGCICSVGAIQNIALALFNKGYTLPLSALLFFLIPILFTMAFGRQFCAGACPLGAIQELTGLYPQKIPKPVETVLSIAPYLYLAFAVLFAATDSHFIICAYDPFVGIFRLNGPLNIIIFGILLLIAGIFVNRPYCRFLCPYGVILNWVSRFSKKHLTIAPDTCINCRLCEESCPYEAITPTNTADQGYDLVKSRKRFIVFLVLLPVFTVGGVFFTGLFSDELASVNSTIRLARVIRLERTEGIKAVSIDAEAFKASGQTYEQLLKEERQILRKFQTGSLWVGGFLGISLGIALLTTTINKKRDEYLPDRGKCYSCARCFDYCPVHVDGLKQYEIDREKN